MNISLQLVSDVLGINQGPGCGFWQRIGSNRRFDIAVAWWRLCLLPCKPLLSLQFSVVLVVWWNWFWDRFFSSWLSTIDVAHNVGTILRKASGSQVSIDGFRVPNPILPCDNQHVAKLLLRAGLYSGAPAISYVLLWKLFQPQTHEPRLEHGSYECFIHATHRILLLTSHLLWPSQSTTYTVLATFLHSGEIQSVHRLVPWGIDHSHFVG
jgi:hypothetical protein